jgi:hypothetical protein
LNNDLAYFLGLWIAEGSFEEDVGRITITCGDSDVGAVLEGGAGCGIPFKNSVARPDQWRANSYELLEMMRFLKMPLVKAPQKWLPDFVWSGMRVWAQHLLSGMFDGDGYISTNRNKAGYTTASKRLASDVQLLLTNFGIISRLTCVTSQPTKRVRVASDQYRVEIIGRNVSLLKGILHLRIKRKAEALEAIPSNLFSRRDGLPILQPLAELKSHFSGRKLKTLDSAIGIARAANSDTTYETLNKVLGETVEASSAAEHKYLQKLASDHYYWDEVTDVEGSQSRTYDFTIPDTHSFWSNGFISHNTPKAYNYLYELYKKGQDTSLKAAGEWESWQFPTITSPFIPLEEIEAARNDMDEKSFRQEFEAAFESMSGRVYYPFSRDAHVQPVEFNPKLPIWVGMDFNIDPMSTVIYQPQPNGELWAVDEIVLFGSNTEEVCEELEKRFWRHQSQIVMYPDPAGGQRQHARGESDMDILREKGFKRIKYRKKHPMVADRVNAVNRMLKDANGNVRLKINPRCKHFINALEQTIYKKGTREVDKTNGTEHSADAGGYCIELEFPMRKVEIGGMSR